LPSSAQYEHNFLLWTKTAWREGGGGRGGGGGGGIGGDGGKLHIYITMEFNRADFTLFK
jgi:hypothetical protein